MTIASILLLFHLLISSIARINLFSGCLHYLGASQVIYNANRLTGYSVMGILIERNIWAICEIIFFLSSILLLLPVLRLALIFFNRDLSREFGIHISSFSSSALEIHFQKEFFEGNLLFVPPNIMISWLRSVSTNTCTCNC